MDEAQDIRNHVKMIDISYKPVVYRLAEAIGEIQLQPETVKLIKSGKIKKGNVLEIAEIAGVLAAKKTAEIIPLCHTIPLSHININFEVGKDSIVSRCEVTANYKTGVEMEALVGVTTALLTIWDMIKYLEKTGEGQYSYTKIRNIQITRKRKKL